VDALSRGVRRVEFRDRAMEYQSAKAITDAIAAIDREIAAQIGRRPNTFLPTFSKGI
jgi:hypothetical protein